jgi:hypothetical protein
MLETKVVSQRRPALPRPDVLVPALILLVGIAAQSATYLNHDVAWVLYSSNRMLDGAVFGRDIVAANPPLIWWLSLIPNAIARLLHAPVIAVFRAFVIAVAAASLVACDRLLSAGKASRAERLLFLATAAYLLTIGVHRDFGQREHLAVALALPYVLAVARRMRGGRLPLAAALAIGAAAGLGIAFKPYFLLVPLALEGALLWRRRSPRLLLRPETIGMAGTFTVYAAALLAFARPWLFEAVPALAQVYWAFQQPDSSFLAVVAVTFAIPLLGFALVLLFNPSSEAAALGLAAAGFFAAAMIQGEYYSYHIFPAFAFLLLGFVLGIPRMPRPWSSAAIALAILAAALNLYSSASGLLNRSDAGAFGRQAAAMNAFVESHVPPGGSFLAIATHPYPGFPTALYAQREWASTRNSRIFLPAVVRLREGSVPPNPRLLSFAESGAREAMLRDLSKNPDLVLIDQQSDRHAIGASKFDFLAFYSEDPRFAALWSHYIPLPGAPDGFAAYAHLRGARP